tara:strand:- start:454 stop:879 length:426 start_codon:yes stop_codon:yes gene_type:complete
MYKKIKKALKAGGMIFAPRRSGKSIALIEILQEESDSVLIVCSKIQKFRLYHEMTKDKTVQARILVNPSISELRKFNKIYVDEFLHNSDFQKYKAHALITSPFNRTPLKVILASKKLKEEIKELIKSDDFSSEFLLNKIIQ